MSVVYNKFIII